MSGLNQKRSVVFLLFVVVFISYLSWDQNVRSDPVDFEFRVINVVYPENYIEIVKTPPRKTNYTNVTLEFSIINHGMSEISLQDIKIISNFGGNELGNSTVSSPIRIPSGSSHESKVLINEDWSNIMTIERSMNFSYGLKTKAGGFFSKENLLKIHQFQTMESIYPAQVETDNGFYDKLSNNIINTRVLPDSIPPIDEPKYLKMNETSFMNPNDKVYLVESDVPRIYPKKIMLWHEIVNDEIDGRNVSITYCPLTDTAIRYSLNFSGETTTFGTSGRLLNSNLVLYDRETDSLWSQILGKSVVGERKDVELDWLPVVTTTWKKAITVYPDALVLSTDTGAYRDYDTDPYESYYAIGRVQFPVMHRDTTLKVHTVVIGVRNNNETAAIMKDYIREIGSLSFELGGETVLCVYDESLDTVRVSLIDSKIVESIEVFWFGWYAFYPETKLLIK